MQQKSLLFLLFTVFYFFSPLIVHGQSADIDEGCGPLTVKFTAPAGVSSYFWDFKDGSTSILENPTRTFTQAGNYLVEFRESAGSPLIGTVLIRVYEKPELDIIANPAAGCAPLITFLQANNTVNPGISVTGYSWSFGDGNSSSGPNVVNTYNDAGLYTVALSIETNKQNCNVSEIFPDFINVSAGPQVAFSTDPDPAVACTPPLTVSLTNETPGNNISYQWIFGNGNISNEENPPAQDYIFAGEYTISLTATDSTGCATTTDAEVKIGQPSANFIIPDTVCVNQPVIIQNLSGAGIYNWNFGTGAIPSSSTTSNPEVTFTQAGNYTVTLSVAAGTCTGDTSINIYAQEIDASFTADPTFSCSAPFDVTFTPTDTSAFEYIWDFGDGTTSPEKSPTHEYNRPDTSAFSINTSTVFKATLTINSSAGCFLATVQEITLNESHALFMPDVTKGCAPLEVTFSDSSIYDVTPDYWIYHYGDGLIDTFTTEGPHTHTYEETGEYKPFLVIIDSNGCRDTSYVVDIEVGEPIIPIFNTNTVKVCPGDTIKLSDFTNNPNIDAWHFSTESGRSFHCYGDSVLFWSFDDEAGLMDVSLTVEYNGCFSTATKNNYIFVEGPIAHLEYELSCDKPFEVQFRDSSQSATNILWNFGDGQISAQPNPVHTYAEPGDYLVTLTAFNNGTDCGPSADSVIIHIRDVQAVINLDTALCDGVNYDLDGSMSQGVDADCWKGYTWFFTFSRPITTQDSITSQLFDSPGDHNVSLEVTDINGCKDTASLDVTVYQISAQLSADKDLICFPSAVQFTGDSSFASISNIESFEWDFGDGNTLEDVENPLHVFQNANSNPITVTLTVREDSPASCSNTASITIDVYEPVSTIFTDPIPAQLCVGEEIDFSATDYTAQGSNLTWDWNFDNNDAAEGQNVSTVYNAGGIYNVVLTFEEISTGCTGTTGTTVQVQDYPTASFTSPLDDEDVLCAPIAVAPFSNNSISTAPIGQILWDFGNTQTSIGQNVSTSFDKGTYVVQMIASTTFGCRDTISKEYNVVGPEGDFTVDNDLICKGDFVTFTLIDTADVTSFQWDFGDGEIVNNVNPVSHKYATLPPSGETVALLVLQSKEGCELVLEQPIGFYIVLADFIPEGNDYIACIGEDVQLINTATNANSYTWNFGDGDVSVEQNPQTAYDESGTYTVELAVLNTTNGCRDTISKLLAIAPNPVPVIVPDSICAEETASLTVTTGGNGSTYIWSPGALVLEDTANTTTTISLTENTSFTVTEINTEGCIGESAPTEVFVLPLPDTYEPIDTITCPGQELALPVVKPENYQFIIRPAENAAQLDSIHPVVVVNEATELELEILDVFGIGCTSGIIPVSVDVPNEEMLVPNIFTPNNDGLNDHFNFVPAIKNAVLDVTRFQVFSRFGQLVYDNETPDQGWDGKFNGKDATSDAYIYMIEAAIEGCETQKFEGELLLLR